MNRYNEIYSYLTLNPNFNSEFFLLQANIICDENSDKNFRKNPVSDWRSISLQLLT
jgi:hypothetical protein